MSIKDIIAAGIGFLPGSVRFIVTRGLTPTPKPTWSLKPRSLRWTLFGRNNRFTLKDRNQDWTVDEDR